MIIHFSSGLSVLIFFFFSSLFSDKRFVFWDISGTVNGDAIRTIGGGGDGLNDILVRSLSIDGGDGEISTNSFGECNGDKIRGFFSSFIGFIWIGNGFFLGTIFCLITLDVWEGFLFDFERIGSFLIGIVDWDGFSGFIDSCWTEIDCVYDVDGR